MKQRSTQFKKLNKIISGALRSTIRVHGPINQNLVPSVSKRIAGQMINLDFFLQTPYREDDIRKNLIEFLNENELKLIARRKVLDGKNDPNLRAKNKMLSDILKALRLKCCRGFRSRLGSLEPKTYPTKIE